MVLLQFILKLLMCLLTLFIFFLELSCSVVQKGDYFVTSSTEFPSCEMNSEGKPLILPCLVKSTESSKYYLYNQSNAGVPDILNHSQLTPMAFFDSESDSYKLMASIPQGWSDGSVILDILKPSTFIASNILSGINLFGLTGTLVQTKVICSVNPASSKCWTAGGTTGKYIYSTENNGRSLNCNIDTSFAETNGCYANSKGKGGLGELFLLDPSLLPISCNNYKISGNQINLPSDRAECTLPMYNYYYGELNGGGGRETNCDMTKSKFDSACWFNPCVGNVCQTIQLNFAGDSVTGACNVDSLTPNSISCQVSSTPPAPPKYVYTEMYGGRYQKNNSGQEIFCNMANNSSPCFFNGSDKASSTGLKPEKIKANISIFGIVGTFYAAGEWGSGASRIPNSPRIDLSSETQTHSGSSSDPSLPDNYHEVPLFFSPNDTNLVQIDDDGSAVPTVDRSLWGTITCGLTGTIVQRISDCGSKMTTASWNGTSYGNASQGQWKLVTRSGLNKEVWRDDSTGMLWSSLVATNLNWCKASGSSNSANPSLNSILKENDPDDFCDGNVYQKNGVSELSISACFQSTGLTDADSKISISGKGNLNLTSSPLVRWRLPTLYDYQIAEYHGIRFVLPDMGFARSIQNPLLEWTGTINSLSSISEEAWAVDSKEGDHINVIRSAELGVRCIGH